MVCIVCKHTDIILFKKIKGKQYWKCNQCKSIFLDKKFYLSSEDEYKHYLTHNNDINDERYKQFLSNLMRPLSEKLEKNSNGLDYGCGPGPALSQMFEQEGHKMNIYDPFFYPLKENLLKKYDFISCSETIEHFHNPFEEFLNFNNLIIKNGIIGIMTNFYSEERSFENWYYVRDPTHVVFYCKETILYLAKMFNWKIESLNKNIAIFKKN